MLKSDNSLRICIASSGLGHVQRGIEAWAQELARALSERQAAVYLCKGAGTAAAKFERVIPCWKRDSKPAQFVVRWLPKPLGWRLGLGHGYSVEQLSFAWNLLWFLKRQQIDILHVQDPQVALAMQRAAHAGLLRTRTILNHGTEEPLEFLSKIDFLQHGAPWHRACAQQAGVDKEHWTVIPNFVDVDRFHPGHATALRALWGIPDEAIVALVSSAVKAAHKRVDYVINEVTAAQTAQLAQPLWLVVAGSQSAESHELARAAQAKLGERVRFVLNYPHADMPELYRAADLLLHGSLKEMMPMALLEASASGLPCIFHHHPVMSWMIGPGGIPSNLEQPGAMMSALLQLANDQRQRRRLGEQARAHCQANFSRERVVEQIMNYYTSVHHASAHPQRRAA